tara:strand:+ start:41 stop:604 length:564 start_codon:yes stop_codon:yes gene_type:complete
MAITFGNTSRSKAAKLAGTGGTKTKVGVNINGMDELQNFLNRFPQILNTPKNKERIFRENSQVLQNKIKQKISGMPFKKGTVGSRQLEDSVGFITTARSRAIGGGYVGLRVRGAYANKEKSGFYGAWIEVGKNAKSPTYNWGPAKPFIKPAYNETKRILMANMLIDARKIMFKEAKKLRKLGTFGYK